MSSDTSRIAVPVATFVLGSVLSLYLKSIEPRKNTLRIAVVESVRLTREWYVQIHTLSLLAERPELVDAQADTATLDYARNRLLLPDLMLQYEILRRHSRARQLANAVRSFMDEVSSPIALGSPIRFCPYIPRLGQSSTLLGRLDVHLQRIAHEAADFL